MKKILFFGIITLLFSACKKEKTTFDYTTIKIKQAIRYSNGNTDTTNYIYTGENVETRTIYSYNPSTVYRRVFTKSGNQFLAEYYTNSSNTHSGFYRINADGLFDTARFTNLNTLLFNNRDRYYNDSEKRNIRSISNYNTYINDYLKYYNSEDDYTYWIATVNRLDFPLLSTKDSIVFEYYLDKPQNVLFSFALEKYFGKPTKHLVKKRLCYDMLNSMTLRRTFEYEYELDSDGLVTQQIWKAYNQPGNVLTSSDTTKYFYYKD